MVVLATMAVFAVVTRAQVNGLKAQHDLAVSLQDEARDLAYLSSDYLLYLDDTQVARWNAVFESFTRNLDRLEEAGSEPAVVSSIRVNAGRLQSVFVNVVSTAITGGGDVSGKEALLRVSWSRMEVQNRQIDFDATRLETLLEMRLERANLVSTAAAFGLMGLFGLLILVAYMSTYRHTMAGIAVLHAGAAHVGRGDLDYVIPADRRDEIGDLSRAFNSMTAALKNITTTKDELEKEVAERKQAEEATGRLLAERSSLLERLQTTLLHVPRSLPGVRFSHLYRSAASEAQVGGDFYDVFEAGDRRIGLLIGDVSGHGIEAARIATFVRDTVHAFAHQLGEPHAVLREANRLLVKSDLSGFVTAFLAFLDPATGTLTFSSAGHPAPMVASNDGSLKLESLGLPLGVFTNARYRDTEVRLAVGSRLLLYTDGITEVRRRGVFFGEEGLRESLTRIPDLDVEKLPAFLLEEALRFSRGRLDDDVALLAVTYDGPAHA